MALKDEIAKFTQPDGLISPDVFPTVDSTGNGLLYLSLYHLLLVRLGISRPEDYDSFNAIVMSCVVQDDVGVKLRGLYYRSPTKKWEMESWDDYVGVAVAARRMSSTISSDIAARGRSSRSFVIRWIYNCLAPGKFTRQSWFGRDPAIPATFLWATNLKPSILRRFAVAVSIAWSAIAMPKNASNVVQTWLKLDACDSRSFLVVMAGVLWSWRTRHAWGVGHMADPDRAVMALALGEELGPSHPIPSYWR